jgi:pyruvate/2-oxoglutarate dehydrogenase complex dihydrolipoamide acyltransferase (E2) component
MTDIKVQDGANKIPVGQVIAILAEEGDDLASIEVPKDLGPEDSSAPSSSSSEKKEAVPEKKEEKPAPKEEKKTAPAPERKEEPSHAGHKVVKHSKPLFPSVSRLYVHIPFILGVY